VIVGGVRLDLSGGVRLDLSWLLVERQLSQVESDPT